MFKSPFSFDGRIRRTEYGITVIIYFVVSITINLMTEGYEETTGGAMLLLLYIPLLWFVWAQGAKRCHDIGNNGWFQIIPFYFLILIFKDGEDGENGYGLNPKGIGNDKSYDAEINEIGKSLEP